MTPLTLVIDRTFPGVGRIKRATGTTLPIVRRKLSRMLTALYEEGRLDLLRAIRDGDLTMLEVHAAYQRKELEKLPTAATVKPLATAMTAWISSLRVPDDCSAKHKESLETSRRYFEKHSPKAVVADLPRVLESLRTTLGLNHPRSFNLARAAAMAFVRQTLKRTHALYAAVGAVELRKTVARQGSPLSVTQMRGFFPAPETDHVDAIAWTMATTGMGASELWGKWHVASGRVHIDGTKRAGRVRDVPLARTPVVPRIHRRTFEDALRDRTDRAIRPYDLRRTYAHWLELANIPRTRRRIYLGHGAGDVTELYERHDVADYLASDAKRIAAVADERGLVESAGADAPRRKRGVLVYFIQREASGEIKIGSARDVLARLQELQVGSPKPLALIGTLPGGRERERAIHRQFAALHIRGEWFRGDRALLAWIREEIAAANTKDHTTTPNPLLHIRSAK